MSNTTTLATLLGEFHNERHAPVMLEVQPGRFALLDSAQRMDVQPDPVAAGVFVPASEHPSGLSFGARVLVLRLISNEAVLPAPAPPMTYAKSKIWERRDRAAGRTLKPWDDGDGPPNGGTIVRVTLQNGHDDTGRADSYHWDDQGAVSIVKLEWN